MMAWTWTLWVKCIEMSVVSFPSVLLGLSVQSTLHTVPNSAWCFNSELILFPQGSVCDAMVQCYCYQFSCTSVYQSQISTFALTLTHNTSAGIPDARKCRYARKTGGMLKVKIEKYQSTHFKHCITLFDSYVVHNICFDFLFLMKKKREKKSFFQFFSLCLFCVNPPGTVGIASWNDRCLG